MTDISALARAPDQKDYNTLRAPEQPRKRVPRRVLHFSDGTLEEYSTEDEDVQEAAVEEERRRKESEQAVVDPRTLRWFPWMLWIGICTSIKCCGSLNFELLVFGLCCGSLNSALVPLDALDRYLLVLGLCCKSQNFELLVLSLYYVSQNVELLVFGLCFGSQNFELLVFGLCYGSQNFELLVSGLCCVSQNFELLVFVLCCISQNVALVPLDVRDRYLLEMHLISGWPDIPPISRRKIRPFFLIWPGTGN